MRPRPSASAASSAIFYSVFCVRVSLGGVPIIRCSRGHAAEHVARKLDKKLRGHLKASRGGLFAESVSATGSFERPLLAILDRNIDLATMLHHTWTYQALVQDLLSLKLNRVTYGETAPGPDAPQAERKTFDLDSRNDAFWAKNRGLPFPQVAEAVESELAACKAAEDEIRSAGAGPSSAGDGGGSAADNTAKIRDAVSSLPQLLEQKRQLKEHMAVLMAVMEDIKKRGLDDCYGAEDDLMNENKLRQPLADGGLLAPQQRHGVRHALRVLRGLPARRLGACELPPQRLQGRLVGCTECWGE